MLEEAEKRDHRRLGTQLDLFHMQEEAPGMVFWHPKGWALWQQVEQYMRRVYRDNGYQEVRCPQILDVQLWEKTGHWENYKDNMFTTESEKRDYAVKPMNCPGHVQIFNKGVRSYRDLPLRYGEFGACHRNEPSGALHGLMRVRGFTQDDGHIFCTEDQILPECVGVHGAAAEGLRRLRLHRDHLQGRHAAREAHRLRRVVGQGRGRADGVAARARACEFEVSPGEGAFYGPKIEYSLKDAHRPRLAVRHDAGRLQHAAAAWARSTSTRTTRASTPVMLHRAIVGSMERFIGILIENHAGALPLWLAPVQVVVMNVTDRQEAYVREVEAALARGRIPRRRPICGTRKLRIKFGNIAFKSFLTSWSSATRKLPQRRSRRERVPERTWHRSRSRPLFRA